MAAQPVSSEGGILLFRLLMISCPGSLHGIWDVQLWLSQLLLQQQWWERTQSPLEKEVSVEGLQCTKAAWAPTVVSQNTVRNLESSQASCTTPPSISGACCSDMLGCTDCAVMALCVEDRWQLKKWVTSVYLHLPSVTSAIPGTNSL